MARLADEPRARVADEWPDGVGERGPMLRAAPAPRPVAGCRGGTCRTVKLSPAGRHRQPGLAGMDSIPRAGTGTRQCGVVGGPSCSSQRQDRALTARERRVAGDQLLFVTPLPCCSPGPPPGRLRAADPRGNNAGSRRQICQPNSSTGAAARRLSWLCWERGALPGLRSPHPSITIGRCAAPTSSRLIETFPGLRSLRCVRRRHQFPADRARRVRHRRSRTVMSRHGRARGAANEADAGRRVLGATDSLRR